MIQVKMPVVGQDIPTGIIKEWLKKEGETVAKEEIIATVESEKATFDVEAPADGVLLKILRQEEEEVEVLTAIAYIGEIGESFNQVPGAHEQAVINAEASVPEVEETVKLETGKKGARIFVSPLAKKIAEKEGVNLGTIIGTGIGGRIIKKNVLDALQNSSWDNKSAQETTKKHTFSTALSALKTEYAGGVKEVAFNRMRQIIADKLTFSKQTVPHFYLFSDFEMDNALHYKKKLWVEKNVKITVTDLVVYTVSKAMIEFPRINSHVYSNKYVLLNDINIGLAVSSDEGLRVPVLTNVDRSGLVQLSAQTKKLADEARKGKFDLNTKAGLTVTTLGMFGVDSFMPIINPPESAIVAVGKSSPRVVTDGTNISIKNIMTVTLACDHRLIDGDYAANFLHRVKELIELADFKELNW
jgi:pyruvate dehydrogenase E2 component (dihydrolipoamide acetyltransferase)